MSQTALAACTRTQRTLVRYTGPSLGLPDGEPGGSRVWCAVSPQRLEGPQCREEMADKGLGGTADR